MAINVSLLTDYSWSDIAKAAKTAMLSAALGGGRLVVNGQDITRISIADAKELYNTAQEMIALESDSADGGNVLVQFGEPQ